MVVAEQRHQEEAICMLYLNNELSVSLLRDLNMSNDSLRIENTKLKRSSNGTFIEIIGESKHNVEQKSEALRDTTMLRQDLIEKEKLLSEKKKNIFNYQLKMKN